MKLRRMMAVVSVVAMALLPMAAVADGADVTVKGEVLDLACYVAHNGEGADHAGCAMKCLKSGQPMGLKAEDGTVYVLFADHGDAAAYDEAKGLAGKMVQVSGPVADKAGIKGLTVHEVKAL